MRLSRTKTRKQLPSLNGGAIEAASTFRPLADALGWQQPCPVVSVPADASVAHRTAAEKLARAFGLSVRTGAGSQKGFVWLEIRSWDSAQTFDGYIILHDEKGSVITASSQRWLDAAVNRFIASSRSAMATMRYRRS